ncbi:MAG: hypothetical protein ACM3O7_00125 [Acidobacteriota bacterium]
MVTRRLLAAAAMLTAAALGAQTAPRVVARFAPGTVPGTVRYQVLLEGLARTDIRAELGRLDNLVVIAGPMMSQEIAWEDQQTSAVTSITWMVRAAHPGPIAVGPTTLTIGGTTLQTAAVHGRAFLGDGGAGEAGGPRLELELSRSRVTVGEAFVAAFSLHASGLAADRDWDVVPRFPSSWSEPLPLEALRHAAAGSGAARRTLAGWLVIPAHPGRLEIPGASARPSRSDPDQPLTPSPALTSAPATIEVDPLPTPPAGYFGAVGRLTVSRTLVPPRVRVGELATVEVEVRGKGNFPLMSQPPCDLPAGVRSFPSEEAQDWKAGPDGLVGFRTWRIPVSADRPGRFHLPELTVASYVPGKGYEQHALPALELVVDPLSAVAGAGEIPERSVPAGARGWPVWSLLAFLGGALLAVVALGWRRRVVARALLHQQGDVDFQITQLESVLESWSRTRYGVGPEAGERGLVLAGCPLRLAAEVTALFGALRRARLAPGLTDPGETLTALRARLEQFLGAQLPPAARIAP